MKVTVLALASAALIFGLLGRHAEAGGKIAGQSIVSIVPYSCCLFLLIADLVIFFSWALWMLVTT